MLATTEQLKLVTCVTMTCPNLYTCYKIQYAPKYEQNRRNEKLCYRLSPCSVVSPLVDIKGGTEAGVYILQTIVFIAKFIKHWDFIPCFSQIL